MRNRIERLRLWLLAGAGLLVLVLGVFIGSARYLRRHLVGRLPQKLGSNIKSETNNVTLSHTSKGGTVYKLRAKKEDELTDGKIAFLDAQIMLYGPKQNRADRIYGDEFQYDESAGLLRAIGLVHIDMQAAAAADGKSAVGPFGPTEEKAAAKHKKEDSGAKVLHATTSGLVYMEKLSVAATSERVEFQLGEMSGHATGADYSSDSDVLTLHSDVYVSGIANGRPLVLTAASAEIDNRDHVTFLTHARYVSQGKTVEADHATVHTRPDGTLERIETEGNVKSEARGAKLNCARGDVLLNANGQPKSALLSGAVTYVFDELLRQRRGQADSAAITFDGQSQPQPEHAVFTGSVHMTERTRTAGAGAEKEREPWSASDLTASRVEMVLVPAGAGKVQPRDVEATGGAHLTVVKSGSLASAKGAGKTELSADDLKAHFLETKGVEKSRKVQPEIDTLAGRGHTLLHQISADGTEQTSAGDILDAKFRPGALGAEGVGRPGAEDVAAGTGKKRQAVDVLSSAVQQGHVHVVRRKPANGGDQHSASTKDDVEDAVAARAAYDGDTDRMTLTGGVELTEDGSVIWANQIGLDHKTGDARAEGSVKVDYVDTDGALAGGAAGRNGKTKQADAREPAHILADRAELNHATSVGTFYGRPARMWQGGSQVQAPMLEFAKEQKKLIARSDAGASNAGSAAEVHTMLVSSGDENAGAGKTMATKIVADKSGVSSGGTCKSGAGGAEAGGAAAGGARPRSQVVRIASHELMYSGLTRQADFSGGVKVQSADGTLLAREATVFLQKPEAGAGGNSASGDAEVPASAGLSMDGRIDRVVAAGKVEIEQPRLHATGGGLTYTSGDGVYLLTGDGAVLPKVTDAQGTTTAAAFRFSSGDCGVEALSTVPGEKSAGQRVRTDTTVFDPRKPGRSR